MRIPIKEVIDVTLRMQRIPHMDSDVYEIMSDAASIERRKRAQRPGRIFTEHMWLLESLEAAMKLKFPELERSR